MATCVRTFSTVTNQSGTGFIPWSSPGNAAASDDSRATASTGAGAASNYLKCIGSAHASGTALGAGDTINSITYKVERRCTTAPGSTVKDEKLYAVESDIIVTANNYANTGSDWTATDTVDDHVQSTNLPTAAVVLAADWGCALSIQLSAGVGATGEVDQVFAEIDFTPAPSPVEEYESNIVVPKWQWEQRKLTPRYDEHVCPGILIGVPVMRQGTKLPPLTLNFSYNIQLPVLSAPQRLVPLAAGTGISWLLNIPTLALHTRTRVPTLQYNTVIRVPLLRMISRAIPAYPVYNYQCILPVLSTESRLRPLIPAFSIVINIPKLNLELRSHALVPGIIQPSLAAYVEPQRSSSAQIIYGSNPGPFKLNMAAGSWRRSGRVHIVHTDKVKPNVCTVEAQFTLVSYHPNMAIGEFVYERNDGYLTITNLDAVNDALIPDGDSFAISTTPGDAPLSPMLITIDQPPTVIP